MKSNEKVLLLSRCAGEPKYQIHSKPDGLFDTAACARGDGAKCRPPIGPADRPSNPHAHTRAANARTSKRHI